MPPPVEPAQAPQNMRITRIIWEKWGQSTKSAVAKPVVEMMDATDVYKRQGYTVIPVLFLYESPIDERAGLS